MGGQLGFCGLGWKRLSFRGRREGQLLLGRGAGGWWCLSMAEEDEAWIGGLAMELLEVCPQRLSGLACAAVGALALQRELQWELQAAGCRRTAVGAPGPWRRRTDRDAKVGRMGGQIALTRFGQTVYFSAWATRADDAFHPPAPPDHRQRHPLIVRQLPGVRQTVPASRP